ncbi:MAG: hypothetical protein JNL72_00565 [Flavipsychrobacter sp.]|nr:hypothetical protein [Flavipsychrobacter sp.]
MKKILLSLSLLAAAGSLSLLTSCDAIKKKVKDEAGVDLNFTTDGIEGTFDIPVITTLNVTTYPDTVEMPMDLEGKIKAYSSLLGMDDVTSVTIEDMDLIINNADNANDASNFYTALAILYSDSKPDAITVSSNDVIPDTHTNTIELVPSPGINLLDYMKSGTKLYYVTGVNMRKTTSKVLNCTLRVKYHIQ